MKKSLQNMCIVFALILIGTPLFAQDEQNTPSEQKVYVGIGAGLDYGGIGGKVEYLPTKKFGVFAGLGYDLLSVGWNIGATYKIMPDKKISFNPMIFYGYNAVSKVSGASQYDMTSYGITIGANLDIKIGNKGDTMSFGLFVPIRSSKFNDNYDEIKDHPYIEIENDLLPIAISIGYNFRVK